MAKKSQVNKSNLLYQRLKEALDRGSKIQIEAEDSFSGIPINLDEEFVEIILLVPPDEYNEDDDEYKCLTWLIRLESIFAISYPTQTWSKEKLANLLKPEVIAKDN
ncbi:MAG: hypothetical protein GDA43_10955 [Hormoscilla sp. SP5CHS1]|nr:hypothetical protein [Hormoscilla sp. SP5CHS1]